MSRILRRLLFVVIVLLLTIPASAQPIVNTRVPVCSGSDFTAIADALADFATAYSDVNARLNAPSPDFDVILARADRLQREWWRDTVPELPPCAISAEITPIIGQMVDELLVTLLYMDANLMSFAEDHLVVYTDAAAAFSAYVAEVMALVD